MRRFRFPSLAIPYLSCRYAVSTAGLAVTKEQHMVDG